MKASVPVIEIADDADALRIRRPNGEARPRHAVNRAQLRAELVIDAAFVAFAEEIQVLLAQRWQKRIRIALTPWLAGVISDDEIVSINVLRLAAHTLEHTGLVNALKLNARFIALMHRLHFDVRGVRKKRANDDARAVAERMHSQECVRRAMPDLDQTFQFPVRQNHARTMTHLTERPNSKFETPNPFGVGVCCGRELGISPAADSCAPAALRGNDGSTPTEVLAAPGERTTDPRRGLVVLCAGSADR